MGPSFGRRSDVPSAPFDKSHDLRDIDFWLNRFFETEVYCTLKYNVVHGRVHWRLGVGPTFSFTRVLSSILQEGTAKFRGPFDLVIKVDLNEAPKRPSLGVTRKLAIGIADKLGLLGPKYSRIKEDHDEQPYYSYGLEEGEFRSMERHIKSIVPQIFQNLSTKRYLLMVDNMFETIEPNSITVKVGLPPTSWKGSIWLVMPTVLQGDDDSGWSEIRPRGRVAAAFGKGDVSFTEDEILMLILSSLHQAAKDIYNILRYKDEQYWHLTTLRCFHYAMLFFPRCSPPLDDNEDHESSNNALITITSDELIRQWAAQEFFTVIDRGVQEIMKETNDFRSKYNDYYDIHQVGSVILEVFRDCSLLELPFSPATKADEATKTAAHFLAHRGLIAERLTTDEFCDDDGLGQENIQWISQGGDQEQGWYVSRDWLSQGTSSGPSALILRHCSQKSSLLAKLDHILVKLPYLRVLDLSYTPLGLLPPSICCLQKLQLISLRGCYNLTSPFSFPKAEVTPSESKNDTGNKILLLYLDLSYSNINTFHSCFFHNMPNLQELVLVKCSNLVELPLSIAVLSSLEILEVTETQIKSIHGKGFKNLRSLKLIGNKKLLSLSGSVSNACGLIDQHSKEWESCVQKEITLEGHPTLRSFTLIDAPLIRRLSLCRCRNLDSIDIKEVDALEELDLSSTSITELPADVPNLPKLRKLFIMDVPSLRRFPWHELQRLPDVFRLGHSYSINGDNSKQQVVQVCVSDSRILYTFAWCGINEEILTSFYIRVTPCNRGIKNMMDEEEDIASSTDKIQVSASAYVDVNCHYLSLVSQDVKPPFLETERHLEISALDKYHPQSLREVLRFTKSIRMTYDDQFPSLNAFHLEQLEYCSLLQCHRMVHVFNESYSPPRPLKSACVSCLRSLSYFYKPDPKNSLNPSWDFGALRHLRLDHCPRLEGLMPRGSTLSSLETLDVIFCYNLKVLFYDNGRNGPYELPCLRRIRLQELPLLERLRVDDAILTAPVWEELHVRGCWSLRHLPRLRQRSGKVKVSGERTWWAKLRWERAPDHSSFEPRLPRAVASMRDRIVIKSYLR